MIRGDLALGHFYVQLDRWSQKLILGKVIYGIHSISTRVMTTYGLHKGSRVKVAWLVNRSSSIIEALTMHCYACIAFRLANVISEPQQFRINKYGHV